MSALVIFNPLIPELICSMSGLAYCSNQKRQRMCERCSFQPIVLVLHNGLCSHSVSWTHWKRGCWRLIFLQLWRVCEPRFQSFAKSINPRHYLKTTHWAVTLFILNISWQSDKPRQFITDAHFPLHLLFKDPETRVATEV